MTSASKVHFVLLAAGSGSRFGGEKTLALLDECPVFLHSLRRFMPRSDSMTLVVSSAHVQEYRDALRTAGISEEQCPIITGGATRTESVSNALSSLAKRGLQEGLVAIHDAARPLAALDTFEMLLQAADECGGAIPASPLTDTLLHVDDAMMVDAAISRENAWRVATPQVFNLQSLRRAYDLAASKSYTDDAQVFRAAGGSVKIVPEKGFNLKITYPQDLALAQAMLKR